MKNIITLMFFLFILFHASSQELGKAYEHFDGGQYDQAIKEFETNLPLLKYKYGADDTIFYAKGLYYNAIAYAKNLHYEKAEKCFLETMAIYDKQDFKFTPLYLEILGNLANLYLNQLNYKELLPLHLEIVEINKVLSGTDNYNYRVSLGALADTYRDIGQYNNALPLYIENLAFARKNLADKELYFRKCLNGLAVLYLYMGQYDKALPLFLEDLEITTKVVGKENLEYGTSLNCLAILYQYMGQYDSALPLLLEDIHITEEVLGKNNPEYSVSLNCLAKLYGDLGKYDEALSLCFEAIDITENVLGKNNPEYGVSLRNLADLYSKMGQYEKALTLYLEDLKIIENNFGKKHPDYGINLRNPANLHRDLGNYEKALPLYLEALEITENSLGKFHPNYSRCLNGLAVLYLYMKQYDKALPLLLEDLELTEKTLGKEHPDYGTSLNCLAVLYQSMGQYEQALPLLLEDLEITKKALGKDHPEYGISLNCLAQLYYNMGKLDQAEPYFIETSQSLKAQLQKNFAFALDSEKESVSLKIFDDFDINKSFFLTRKQDNPAIIQIAYDNELALKGVQLQSSKMMRQAILQSNNEIIITKFEDWLVKKEQINSLLSLPISERKLDVDSLTAIADELERELNKASKIFNKFQTSFNISWQDIQNRLNDQEVAIEFISFKYYDGKHFSDSIFYAALLLRKYDLNPQMIYLFEEKNLLKILPNSLSNKSDYDFAYQGTRGSGTAIFEQATYKGDNLYQLIWQPLDSLLKGIETIYFAPSGLLHTVSFAAIPAPNGELLLEKFNLVQLTSTRSIAMQNKPIELKDAVVYGGIQYDMQITDLELVVQKYQNRNELVVHDQPFRSNNIQNYGFNYLDGSMIEADKVSALLSKIVNTTKITGSQAVEESFQMLSGNHSPSIIHIATHGFYFPDTISDKKQEQILLTAFGEDRFKYSDDPLMRSAILMAGSNYSWKGNPLPEGVQDGILTARDVAALNLSNTELVVLSACQTGLGDVRGNEGVTGLQRAFKMAGVRFIIISLWEVPDKETVEMMELFYAGLTNNSSIVESFRHAQNEMKQKYSPYYWAAFVLIE